MSITTHKAKNVRELTQTGAFGWFRDQFLVYYQPLSVLMFFSFNTLCLSVSSSMLSCCGASTLWCWFSIFSCPYLDLKFFETLSFFFFKETHLVNFHYTWKQSQVPWNFLWTLSWNIHTHHTALPSGPIFFFLNEKSRELINLFLNSGTLSIIIIGSWKTPLLCILMYFLSQCRILIYSHVFIQPFLL